MTDIIKITAAKALGALQQAVEERGEEYVYTNPDNPSPAAACVYASGDKPMCGVGVALHKLGVPIEEIGALDTFDEGGTILAGAFHNYQPIPGYEFTEGASMVFEFFQEKQDSLLPWGEAMANAIEAYDKVTSA